MKSEPAKKDNLCVIDVVPKWNHECTFCRAYCDEKDMTINTYCLYQLMSNGIAKSENQRGSGYGFMFREGDEYYQYICSNCCIANDDPVTADDQPYALADRIFERSFIEANNPTSVFKHFIDDSILSKGDGLFMEIMNHAYGKTVRREERINEMMRSSQKRESDIKKSSEYTFYGRELSRMCGLLESDMEVLIESIKPIERLLTKITLREGITLFFHYSR